MSTRDEERWVRDVHREVITVVHDELLGRSALTDEHVPKVTVHTELSLTDEAQDDIRAGVREVRTTFGRGDGRVRVEFDVAPNTRYPCEAVCVVPELDKPTPRPETTPVAGTPRLLVLGFDGLEFHFLLEPGRDWLPLLRPVSGYDGAGLLLPQSLSDVPHGHLVDLFYDGDMFRARRATDRLDYRVSVNAVELVAEGMAAAESGELRFESRVGTGAQSLTYELLEWSDEIPAPGTGADVLDGSSHPAEAGTPGALLIQPPAPGTKAGSRRFPLPTGRGDVAVRDVHVQVLHTTATHPGSAERSHVKIYRCATPQHATFLRRYLATQASLVRQANAVAGKPGEHAWAVAPIHLVAAAAPPEVLTARTDATTVRGAEEHRLSAWFGVPDQPQPDCFVIVASPLLEPVGWAGYEQLGTAPSGVQLAALTALAAGVDHLHKMGVAHCDIKPQNVCHHLDGNGRNTYVLVDGDAVTRLNGPVGQLRFTPEYASAEVIRTARQLRAPGRNTIDLTEHDRFGFVLVVLTALIGANKVEELLRGPEGKRPVDSVSRVADTLTAAWSSVEWAAFSAELAGAFRPGALGGDWSATAWLARLNALWRPDETPRPSETARVASGRYGHEVTAIRTGLLDERAPAWAEWRDELEKRTRAAQQKTAMREYRWWLWAGRLTFAVVVVVAALTLLGDLS